MAAQPQQILKYRTLCRICGQPFVAAPLDITIIGEADERLRKFVKRLTEHLKTRHPDAMALIDANVEDIKGVMVSGMFSTQDPLIAVCAERARYTLHTVTRKTQITDETIFDRLKNNGINQDAIDTVLPVMRDMRDELTEQGQYAPQSAPRSNLVSL